MRSLKEISRNIVALAEGMFDFEGGDRLEKGIAKDTTKMFLDTCKGSFNTVFFKDGSCRVNGKLIISGVQSETLNINIKDFHGKLIIENCPKLTGFEGSFLEKFAIFDGSLTINQCPALVSLVGIPELIKGDLSVTNCKKLKDCKGIDTVFGNIYWSGNGKKYTVDQLKEKVHVIKKVFCGEDEIEADVVEGVVNETLNNQWLQRLAAQLKKYPYKEWSWEDDSKQKYNKLDNLIRNHSRSSGFSGSGRLLDKITNDDIDVYDMSDEKDKKTLGKAFYSAYSSGDADGGDIFLVYNEDLGEFIGGFGEQAKLRGSGWSIVWVNIPHKGSYSNKIDTRYYGKSEARDRILNYGSGYTVVVLNTGKDTGTGNDERWNIRKNRADAQAGVINPGDVEQYKAIAAANMKRYKDMVAQIRLERKKNDEAEGYDKVIDEYEQINTRVFKFTRAITKDPKAFNKYDVERFFTWLRDEKRSNPSYKSWKHDSGPAYYGDNGLMYIFKCFMDAYLSCFGNSYKTKPEDYDYRNLEGATKRLKDAIETADKKLKNFGF
jgi:hypothetical protein